MAGPYRTYGGSFPSSRASPGGAHGLIMERMNQTSVRLRPLWSQSYAILDLRPVLTLCC